MSDAPASDCLWHRYGEFSLFDWSVSGNETCVVVHGQGFRLALDMGACPPQAVDADFVFVTHGHVDHCGALHMHMRKRQLVRLPPATYYLPECLVEPMTQVVKLFNQMQHDGEQLQESEQQQQPVIVGVKPGDEITLGGCGGVGSGTTDSSATLLQLRVFPTDHRVPSVGCLLRRRHSVLLPEFRGHRADELRALVSQGVAVRRPAWEPLLAYTGDTRFSLFTSPPDPDLLRVKLLVCELTYLDGPLDKAEKYGHCHLQSFCANGRLFKGVGRVVFVHFSNRYAPAQILQLVYSWLHPGLGRKVYCGLNAKRLLYSSW